MTVFCCGIGERLRVVPFILHYERLLLFYGKPSFCRRIASQKGIEEPLNVSYIDLEWLQVWLFEQHQDKVYPGNNWSRC
jgi:hypothetical protein